MEENIKGLFTEGGIIPLLVSIFVVTAAVWAVRKRNKDDEVKNKEPVD